MEKRPKILEANYIYLAVAILLISIGGFFQYRNIYSGIFITEYIIILLPMILLAVIKKYNFKEVFKLRKITFSQAIKTVVIAICAYPIALFFNYIMIVIISMFGELRQSPLPVPENATMFLVSIFLFAITPGICEEAMFRGVMMSAYERIGTKKAIVLTGILFGLFHFDIQNFLGPTFLGILFGFMVYKTGSIYTSVLAHTVNNSIALVLLKTIGNQQVSEEATSLVGQMGILLVGLISLGIISIVLSVVVYFLLKSLSKEEIHENILVIEKITIIHMIPIIITICIFIFSAVAYFKFITQI